MGVVSGELVAPFGDRQSEGILFINVEFSPMASPAFERGRPGEAAVSVARLIERSFKEGRAVDLESLCVLSGQKVWSLRVDLHVLDHDGNVVDACALAALGALSSFRRPEVEVRGQELIIHPKTVSKRTGPGRPPVRKGSPLKPLHPRPPQDREPLPLQLHHLPVAVTFALVGPPGNPTASPYVLSDPAIQEEAASDGMMTVVVNAQGDICAIQKPGGLGLPMDTVRDCIERAKKQALQQLEVLKGALEQHKVARVQARIKRRPGADPSASAAAAGAASMAAGESRSRCGFALGSCLRCDWALLDQVADSGPRWQLSWTSLCQPLDPPSP